MQVKELGHLVLYVRDLEASTHFYRDVLGWRPIFDGSDAAASFPAAAFNSASNRTHHELLLIEVGPDAAPLPRGRRVGDVPLRAQGRRQRRRTARRARTLESNGVRIVGGTDHGMTTASTSWTPTGTRWSSTSTCREWIGTIQGSGINPSCDRCNSRHHGVQRFEIFAQRTEGNRLDRRAVCTKCVQRGDEDRRHHDFPLTDGCRKDQPLEGKVVSPFVAMSSPFSSV